MIANEKVVPGALAVSATTAAEMIGISKSKMYELIKSEGCDFAFMVGGRRLVSVEKLSAWVQRQTETAV